MKPLQQMTVVELEKAIDSAYQELRGMGAQILTDEWITYLNRLTRELQSRGRRRPLAQMELDEI